LLWQLATSESGSYDAGVTCMSRVIISTLHWSVLTVYFKRGGDWPGSFISGGSGTPTIPREAPHPLPKWGTSYIRPYTVTQQKPNLAVWSN